MANAAVATASDTDSQPPKGKSRKLIVIGAIVAMLAVGGGAAYYFLAHKKPPADDTKAAEKAVRKPMVYLAMDTFTVNLRAAEEERFLQVTINLEAIDTITVDAIKQQMPSVRNRVLLLLSSKSVADLLSREGKEKLSAEIAEELRKTLDGAGPNKGLEQVLFSHFVIQ